MKSLIICSVLLIFQIILAEEDVTFTELELTCMEKLHLNRAHIESIINDTSSIFFPENNVDYNSLQFCQWNARGLQDINGKFNYDNIVQVVQKFARSGYMGNEDDITTVGSVVAKAAVESCKNIPKGENHGQTTVKLQNCIDKHVMKLIEKV